MQWYWQQRTTVQLLDPMTTLVRVALLKFMPTGTLLRFHHNRILYDGPGLLQGLQRDYARWCGQSASKEDLHNLLPPLLRACEWFGSSDAHRATFKCAVEGLQTLMKTYRKKGAFQTCDAIRSYIRLLQDTLEGRHFVQREFQDLMDASVSEPNVRFVCQPRGGGGAAANVITSGTRKRIGNLRCPPPPLSNGSDDDDGDDVELSPSEIRKMARSGISSHNASSSSFVASDYNPVIDLSHFWTQRQVNIIHLLLEEIGERTAHRSSCTAVMESLERLLNDKENVLVRKIEHACTAV